MTDPQHTDYTPIACSAYSELEEAIVLRRRLRLTWVRDNVVHHEVVTPLDLQTVQGEEFLIGRTAAGEAIQLRLDCLRKWEIV